MAERLMIVLSAGLALAAAGAWTHAQGLSDPTRPPGIAAVGSEGESPTPYGKGVQSILLSPQRKSAVINGQTVVLGGRIGDATLVAISETGVVLRRGNELETLRLLPDVDKKPARSSATRAKGGDSR